MCIFTFFHCVCLNVCVSKSYLMKKFLGRWAMGRKADRNAEPNSFHCSVS